MARKLPDVSNQGSLGSLVKPPNPSKQKRRLDQGALRQREQRANVSGFGGSFLSTEPFDLQPTHNWAGSTTPDLVGTTRVQNIPSGTKAIDMLNTSAFGSTPGLPTKVKSPKMSPKMNVPRSRSNRSRRPSISSSPGRGLLNSAARGLELYTELTHHMRGNNERILRAFQGNGRQ